MRIVDARGLHFRPCLHHFFACNSGSSVNQMWQELGALPRELVNIEECTAAASPDGKIFVDYHDLDRLRNTLLKLSPTDSRSIEQYIDAIKAFADKKIDDTISSGSFWKMLTIFPSMPGLSNSYLVGIWATEMGPLAHNANSGKTIIRRTGRKDGKEFKIKPWLTGISSPRTERWGAKVTEHLNQDNKSPLAT